VRPDCEGTGFLAPASTRSFRPRPAVSLRPPSTTCLHTWFHSPVSFPPSSECYDLRPAHRPPKQPCDHSSADERLSCGSIPHRGIDCGVHSRPGIPLPSYVPSSTFLTSSTVYSATTFAGLFHPAATSRVRPTGICPSPRSRTGFPRPIHALLPIERTAPAV
jgi:hypothetical protein